MQKITRRKLYEEVVAGVLEMIKRGRLSQGDKIHSEKELSDLFGVSRMVIREALSALQANGILEVRHGSGIYLKNVDELFKADLNFLAGKQNILNVLELRKGVESEAAFLAAIRSTEEEQEGLRAILDDMYDEIAKGGGASETDYQFHLHLAQATHNPIYIKVFNEMIAANFYEVLKTSHNLFSRAFGPRLVIVGEHKEILNHIVGRHPGEARRAMWEHLDSVQSKLVTFFNLGQ